jgi:tight adherence protein B
VADVLGAGSLLALAAATLLLRRGLLHRRLVMRLAETPSLETAEAAPRASTGRFSAPGARRELVLLAGLGLAIASVGEWLGLGRALWLAIGTDFLALVHVAMRVRASRRELRVEEQLGEAVRLLAGALRSGSSPVDALHRSAARIPAPLHGPLAEAAGRLRLGDDPHAVFARLAERVSTDSARLLTVALAVQWSSGGSLQRTLLSIRRYAQDRVDLRRRLESQAAPARSAVLTLVGATAAVGFLAWSNDPGNVERFLRDPMGEGLVAGALILQGLSLVWMWRVTQVRV